MDMSSQPSANPAAKLWAGVGLTVLTVLAYIYMKVNSIDESGILTLVSPLIMYLIIGAKVDNVTQEQNQVLAKIDEQTNGILEQKIARVVGRLLDNKVRKIVRKEVTALHNKLSQVANVVDEVASQQSADSPQDTQDRLF